MTQKLPQFLKPYLWSYNINKMDAKLDKAIIIPQVLNHGNWKSIKGPLRNKFHELRSDCV